MPLAGAVVYIRVIKGLEMKWCLAAFLVLMPFRSYAAERVLCTMIGGACQQHPGSFTEEQKCQAALAQAKEPRTRCEAQVWRILWQSTPKIERFKDTTVTHQEINPSTDVFDTETACREHLRRSSSARVDRPVGECRSELRDWHFWTPPKVPATAPTP